VRAGDGHPHGDVFSVSLATAVRGVQVGVLVGATVEVPGVAHESLAQAATLPVSLPARAQLAADGRASAYLLTSLVDCTLVLEIQKMA